MLSSLLQWVHLPLRSASAQLGTRLESLSGAAEPVKHRVTRASAAPAQCLFSSLTAKSFSVSRVSASVAYSGDLSLPQTP